VEHGEKERDRDIKDKVQKIGR